METEAAWLIEELKDQVRNPKNHLEVHGLMFRMNGFPVFNEETSEQVGEIHEGAWDWEKDLSLEDRDYFWLIVGAYQVGIQKHGDNSDREYWTHPHILRALIEEYGIKCWHYSLHRRPRGAAIPPFECLVCGDFVFPDRPLTYAEKAVFEARHSLIVPFTIVVPE